jgi:hypothetical protein
VDDERDELHEEIAGFLTDSFREIEPEPVAYPRRLALSVQDVWRLTLWKWRYSLESAGYSTYEAEHLLFLKWQHARARVG